MHCRMPSLPWHPRALGPKDQQRGATTLAPHTKARSKVQNRSTKIDSHRQSKHDKSRWILRNVPYSSYKELSKTWQECPSSEFLIVSYMHVLFNFNHNFVWECWACFSKRSQRSFPWTEWSEAKGMSKKNARNASCECKCRTSSDCKYDPRNNLWNTNVVP